jgi:hypothetical protein
MFRSAQHDTPIDFADYDTVSSRGRTKEGELLRCYVRCMNDEQFGYGLDWFCRARAGFKK